MLSMAESHGNVVLEALFSIALGFQPKVRITKRTRRGEGVNSFGHAECRTEFIPLPIAYWQCKKRNKFRST